MIGLIAALFISTCFAGVTSTNPVASPLPIPIPIIDGGTNSATANGALNNLLPSQGGNNGKVLGTNGSNTSWVSGGGGGVTFPLVVPTSLPGFPQIRWDSDTGFGSPSDGLIDFSNNFVNTFHLEPSYGQFFVPITVSDIVYPAKTAHYFLAGPTSGSPAIPAFRGLAAGDIPNSALPFPIIAPTSLPASPSFQFDSDTGMGSTGDGVINFTANLNETMRITPLLVNVLGNLTLAGNADITGDSNVTGVGNFSGQVNVGGDLDVVGNISAANYPPSPVPITGSSNQMAGFDSSGAFTSTPISWNIEGGVSVNSTVTGTYTTGNYWNYNAPTTLTSAYDFNRIDSSGDFDVLGGYVLNNGANSTNLQTLYLGNTGNVSNLYRGTNVLNAGSVGGDYIGSEVYNSGAITGGYQGQKIFNANTIGGNYVGQDINNGAAVTGQMTQSNMVNTAANGGYFASNINNSGPVTGQFRFGEWTNSATITQSGLGLNMSNTGGIGGGFGMLNMTNFGDVTNYLTMANVFNSGNVTAGGYTGVQVTDQGAHSGDKKGVDINLSGSGNNVSGLNIDVTNATATSGNNKAMISANGGIVQINGAMTIVPGNPFNIGNYISILGETPAATTLTGADTILQVIQSNLHVQGDVQTGPYGLDTNMLGIAGQIQVDSGYTIPLVRGALIGVTVPLGSGGTITDYRAVELLGLPSFGGSVNSPSKTGIYLGTILGQDFCAGATDCWGVKITDTAAHNWFQHDVVIGGSTGLPQFSDQLDITGDMLLTGKVHDSAGNESIDPTNRLLIHNGNNVVQYDIGHLNDESGPTVALNWFDRLLQDSSSNIVLDWGNQVMKDTSGVDSLKWQDRNVWDATGTRSLNWDSRLIYRPDGTSVIDYSGDQPKADLGLRLSTSGSQPTCDAGHRGLMWNVEGGAGVADLFQVCQKTVLDTYVWINH